MQTDNSVLKLDINLIIPNKYQPRKVFDDKSLDSLSESIKNYGIINPILVRKKDDKYEIIAGERRYRAAKLAGLNEVPVIIKNANEQEMAELALIENLQRKELTPIEEAKSYEEIMKIGNQTQNSLALKLGKSQSAIANKLRLLTLPIEIQDAVTNKKISERHARTLLAVETKEKQLELLERIIKEKLTVKETEKIVNEKEISEEEIKQAISDIMKSLNINEEEKEEKEDDNMNNGNFFPNFDNNNVANNPTSLNMMNMQSMNQNTINPEPEVVMPTVNTFQQETVNPIAQPKNFNQFGPVAPVAPVTPELSVTVPEMQNNFMENPPQKNIQEPIMPTIEPPIMNTSPQFGPQLGISETPTMPMEDVPLFNPNVVMPTVNETPQIEPISDFNQFGPVAPVGSVTPELSVPAPETTVDVPSFEVPVSTPSVDRLTELQNLLTNNGYNYKVYSNETDNCIIIELPKN